MRRNKTGTAIPEGKYRVIKISKEALFEFVYESIMAKQAEFFDVPIDKNGLTNIVMAFDMNCEAGEFIAIARNEFEENEHLQFDEIDSDLLLKNMEDTTPSMFNDKRYVELSLEEIKKLCGS